MEDVFDYSIRPLSPYDNTKSFKTGSAQFQPLKSFLQNHALEFQEQMVAQTYVACGGEGAAEEHQVYGYVTLTCSEVDIRNGYELKDCPSTNRYDSMPAIKIARLAVDTRYRRRGIGEALLDLALAITLETIAPATGCRFLITDSKAESVSFYLRSGFQVLNEDQFEDPTAHPIMFIDLYSAK